MHIKYLKKQLALISTALLITACGEGTVSNPTNSSGFNVTSSTPASNQEISVNQTIEVSFNQDVDKTSLNAYTFQVMEVEGMSLIDGKIQYNPATRTVTFEPYMPLTYDTPFHVMVSDKIRSASNVHLSGTTNINFNTMASPQISTFHPDNGTNNVSPRSSVRIQFGAGINFSSINSASFTMLENNVTPVPVDVELDEDAQTAILWPKETYNFGDGFKPATSYSYTVGSSVLNDSNTAFFGSEKTNSFNTSGTTPFTNYIATNWDEYADSIKLASDGTLIVAGETWGALTDEVDRYDGDGFIAAIDPGTGETLATIQFGSGNNFNDALDIADPVYDMVTINNDIYVTGFTEGNLNSADSFPGNRKLFVAKYTWNASLGSITASGAPVFITASTGEIEGYAITKNSSDTNIYVAGTTTGSITGETNKGGDDIVVAKFDTNLTQLWAKQFGTAARDITKGIAVDGNAVYVAGDTLGDFTNPQNPHVGLNPFLLQLDDSGSLSTTPFDTGAASNIGAAFSRTVTGIAANNGKIYLVGTQQNNNGTSAYGLTYQSSGGTPTYATHGDNTTTDDEIPTGIYVSPTGSVYVAITRFHDMNGETHGMTEILSLDSTNFSPYKTLNAGMHASARSMVMDTFNTMYVTGYVHGDMDGVMPLGMGDVFVAKP